MKTIVTINVADLNTNRIRVVDDHQRGDLAALLLVTDKAGVELDFECTRTYVGTQALEFASFDQEKVAEICDLLNFNLTPYKVDNVVGQLVRVSVLELLDKGWTLVRSLGTNKLRCTPLASSDAITLDFVNDGTNLWAEFDGARRVGAGIVMRAFDLNNTEYEVME